MQVEPLAVKSVAVPVALLVPGHRHLTVIDASGRKDASGTRAVVRLLRKLTGFSCYVAGALTSLRHTTGAMSWTCRTWRGKATAMVHEPTGVSVSSLRCSNSGRPEQTFQDLTDVLDWLAAYGVAPATVSSMAWALWRATLSRKIRISADPELGRAAFFGGRQEVRESRVYQHMAAIDIRAAYPTGMASRPYALHLRQVSPSTQLDANIAGLAFATVVVPADLPYAPLPQRLAPQIIQFPTGRLKGVWTWCELDCAARLGCSVSVHSCWAPTDSSDLFGTWWTVAANGRTAFKSPGATDLIKCITNSLWGQFAMDGSQRAEVRWTDDSGLQPIEAPLDPRRLPHTWACHLAAETAARVRTRLLLEGIYGSVGGWPVHVDTDGIVVRRSQQLPADSGDALGQWRVKAQMPRIDIRAPQLYRFTCGKGCGITHARWHYIASGVPADHCAHYFEHEPPTRISYRSQFDINIPSCHVDEREQIDQWLLEARSLAGLA